MGFSLFQEMLETVLYTMRVERPSAHTCTALHVKQPPTDTVMDGAARTVCFNPDSKASNHTNYQHHLNPESTGWGAPEGTNADGHNNYIPVILFTSLSVLSILII